MHMKKINELTKLIQQVKTGIQNEINSLPDNPNIQRLSNIAYSMPFSEIAKDKDQTFSAEYYDFKYQYREIADRIESLEITEVPARLKEWTNAGYLPRKQQGRIKLHPQVIAYIQKLIETL